MPSYNQVLGSINSIGGAAIQGVNAVGSLFSSGETSASSIRNTFLNGFLNEGNSKFTPLVFSRLFDEPTYLTFRIEFNFDNREYNSINTFDYLPEPLLTLKKGESESVYSTCDYLSNSLGERRRADMLNMFINSLMDIQNNYPYYFTNVSGLDNLLKVAPADGIRLKEGENKITIKCLEGLDLKITQLIQLYKNVVWDEVYQRWMLPDMMRYFNMKIYISEIRLFHSTTKNISNPKMGWLYDFRSGNHSLNASSYDQLKATSTLESLNKMLNTAGAISGQVAGTNSTVAKTFDTINHTVDTATGIASGISGLMFHLCNNAINDVMPTICLDCHMCEFDITDTFKYLTEFSSSNKNINATEPEIVINVGKLFVSQLYPLNADISNDGNGYVIDLNKQLMAGSYINEITLSRRNTTYSGGLYVDLGLSRDSEEVRDISRITSGIRRMGLDTYSAKNDDLAYKPGIMSQETAATALTQGILNIATGGPGSTAADLDEEDISNIRNNFTNENPRHTSGKILPISNESATTTSTATSNRDYFSRVVTNDGTSSSSTATDPGYYRSLQSLIEKYGESDVAEGLTYMNMIRSSATQNKTIENSGLTEDEKKIASNAVLEEILENIESSKATSGENIITELTDLVLENKVLSKATSKDNKINGFEALN